MSTPRPGGATRTTVSGIPTPTTAREHPWRLRREPVLVVLVVATVLGLGLRLYQLSRPGYLLGVTEYDDGADFGSAIRLVHGVLAYRDFVTVQPPGITLLMAPAALLAGSLGTAKALAVGRVLTACAGAASIPLGGLLVRHRGLLATTLACGILAVYPGALAAAHTVLLEPWLTLCCLIGALVVFDGDRLADDTGRSVWRSRLVWGGVAFGFGGAVKVWAVLPVIVIAVLCLPQPRRLMRYVGGVAVGFAVPVLPFAAAAPGTFVRSVIWAQLVRVDNMRTPLLSRLVSLTGLTALPTPPTNAQVVWVAVAIVVVAAGGSVLASLPSRRPAPALESFALFSAGLVVVAFCAPYDYGYHYAGFFAPFLALAVALPVGRLATTIGRGRRAAVTVAVCAIVAVTIVQAQAESGLAAGDPGRAAAAAIPPGACVLTDTVSLTIAANRFVSTAPGCPVMVDGVGTDYALSAGHNGVTDAGSAPAVESTWLSAFEHTRYVWLSCVPAAGTACESTANRRIPWTPTITTYFDSHFRQVRAPGLPGGLFARTAS
jgi:alpha-1,2-mannosyltransferase